MADKESLAGRVAVVTGAGRGIGRAIAVALARKGASVVLAARSHAEIAAVAAAICAAGGTSVAVPTDVRNDESVAALADQTRRSFGNATILFNNAGANPRGAFLETSLEAWRESLEVNLLGAVRCCRAFLPGMIAAGGGRIINIGSGIGQVGHAGQSAYGAAKAALHNLTQALAEEMWPHGVLVNTLIPGPVRTQLSRPAWEKGNPWVSERWKEPEEVVPLALFLATLPPTGPTGQIFSLMRRSP